MNKSTMTNLTASRQIQTFKATANATATPISANDRTAKQEPTTTTIIVEESICTCSKQPQTAFIPMRPLMTLKLKFDHQPNLRRRQLIQLLQDQYGADSVRGAYYNSSFWYVTCTMEETVNAMLDHGIIYINDEGQKCVCYPDCVNDPVQTVVLSSLDPLVADEIVLATLAKFGPVYSRTPLRREYEDGIENGCRIVKMTVYQHIPLKIRLHNATTREETQFCVSYPNQMANLTTQCIIL